MQVIRDPKEWKSEGEWGAVLTMGGLHAGHAALIQKSLEEMPKTVVSIFLNPTQFDEATDLENYPANLQEDLELLEKLGVDAVFLPTKDMLYSDGYRYRVTEVEESCPMEGAARAGHFSGVLSVVMKLLNILRPKKSYFGEKDYQQYQLIKGMCEAFFINIDVVGVATVREADGLAMSSRNRRLSPEKRRLAPKFYEALRKDCTCREVEDVLTKSGFKVDYVEHAYGRRFGAVRLGDVRLIDNVPV